MLESKIIKIGFKHIVNYYDETRIILLESYPSSDNMTFYKNRQSDIDDEIITIDDVSDENAFKYEIKNNYVDNEIFSYNERDNGYVQEGWQCYLNLIENMRGVGISISSDVNNTKYEFEQQKPEVPHNFKFTTSVIIGKNIGDTQYDIITIKNNSYSLKHDLLYKQPLRFNTSSIIDGKPIITFWRK